MSTNKPTKKRPTDMNELAHRIGMMATGEIPIEPPPEVKPEKNVNAVALGKLGGAKGGHARAKNMTSEERAAVAKKAAAARWETRS